MKCSQKQKNRGFTLLFAVLVSSLILAIGASIITIGLKQVVFSSAGRESQFSYYAADSGVECALLWDFGKEASIFAKNSAPLDPSEPPPPNEAKCGSGDIITGDGFEDGSGDFIDKLYSEDNNFDVISDSTSATSTFRMVIEDNSNNTKRCVQVQVAKWYDTEDSRIKTRIDSRGYNTCSGSFEKRYERGLRVDY